MRFNRTLWTVQGLLAALFLMSGTMKLIMPMEAMAGPVALPEWFMRFLGVAETAGGLGLILPGIFKIRQGLTPLAAAGLVIIMTGATVLSAIYLGAAVAAGPFVFGLMAAAVCYGRTRNVVPPVAARATSAEVPAAA